MPDKLSGWRNEQGDLMLYSTAPNNGGYPLFYINTEDETVCPECAQQQDKLARAAKLYHKTFETLRPQLEALDTTLGKLGWPCGLTKLVRSDLEAAQHEANLGHHIIDGAIAEEETYIVCAVCQKIIVDEPEVDNVSA